MAARVSSGVMTLGVTPSAMQDANARLLILDSLVDFLGEVDENSNPEMGRVAERLRAIAEESGGTILAIHHTPKYGTGPRGATSLRNGVDVSCNVTRDGATLHMSQDKNRASAECTVTARMSWDNSMFSLSSLGMATGRQKPPPDADEAAILDELKGGEWVLSSNLVTKVMQRTGHKRRGLLTKLKGLCDAEILQRQDTGAGKPYQVRLLRSSEDGCSDLNHAATAQIQLCMP